MTFGLAFHLALFCLWEPSEDLQGFTRLNLLQLIFSVEFLLSVSIFAALIVKTIAFNRTKPPPDPVVSQATFHSSAPETGYK